MEMLKGFPIQKYLDKKPPSENSVTTKGEVKELSKLPIREKFIKEKDDIKKSFESIVGKDEIIQKLLNELMENNAQVILGGGVDNMKIWKWLL